LLKEKKNRRRKRGPQTAVGNKTLEVACPAVMNAAVPVQELIFIDATLLKFVISGLQHQLFCLKVLLYQVFKPAPAGGGNIQVSKTR
jgi:hypothetical protein